MKYESEVNLNRFVLSGWFGFGSKTEPEEDVVNIFSLASGHLYERLLRIMMLSVLKNTK